MIASYKDGQIVEKTNVNSFYEKSLSNRFNILWISKTENLFTDSKKSNFYKKFDNKKYPLLGFESKVDGDFFIVNIRFKKFNDDNRNNDLKRKFIVNLDNEIFSDPQWIKNHRTKEKDIIIQDYKNKIYLFSNKGLIGKNIDGKIIGKVKQVDLFKNGNYRFFRTEKV